MSDKMTRRSALRKGTLATVVGGSAILGTQTVTAASNYELRVDQIGPNTGEYWIHIYFGSGSSRLSMKDVDSDPIFTEASDGDVSIVSDPPVGATDIFECENCKDPEIREIATEDVAVYKDDEQIY
ncbi:hypothetical protein [Halomontanus rarus]|uniref:hypothetical protein n=1 Tax=Halomontanus rarus TaxID=3034020 RepID=UPI0023E85807|nr:hypothetical protein [Halovivax sp. TS33]